MEKRQVSRHALQVPAHVEVVLNGDVLSCKWKTRDISTRGAFFFVRCQLLEKDTAVKIDLHFHTFSGSHVISQVKLSGRVVRTESEGVGICFDSQYHFVSNAPGRDM